MSIQLRQWLDRFHLLETETVKLPIRISNREFCTQWAPASLTLEQLQPLNYYQVLLDPERRQN